MINIEKLITESAANISNGMGLQLAEVPQAEVLRYFRFQEVPFLLFYLAKKNHRTTLRQIHDQYELQTGQTVGYQALRHLVRKFYDEVERAKMMEGKSKQN